MPDHLGTVSGYKVPDKFERTGLKAEKSRHVDAPIIVGSPVVIECELIEFVETENFTTVLTRVVNMAADGSTHRIVRSVRQTSLIMIC